jgi:CxxC-x17-CxxC domain-containing protein
LDARLLPCTDCGAQFEFTVEEQERFTARGFSEPKRCKRCRDVKRRRQAERDGARRPESAPRPSGPAARQRPAATMHPAKCTVCGDATEVPFVPDGVRPVYCLPCLKQRTR